MFAELYSDTVIFLCFYQQFGLVYEFLLKILIRVEVRRPQILTEHIDCDLSLIYKIRLLQCILLSVKVCTHIFRYPVFLNAKEKINHFYFISNYYVLTN